MDHLVLFDAAVLHKKIITPCHQAAGQRLSAIAKHIADDWKQICHCMLACLE